MGVFRVSQNPKAKLIVRMTIDAVFCGRNKKILHGCHDFRDSKIKHDTSESEAMIEHAPFLSFHREYRFDFSCVFNLKITLLILCCLFNKFSK